MKDFDLLVIGGGPGGLAAAQEAAERGLRVALAERREIGGTCLNRGCIPTKALLHGAELFQAVQAGSAWGVRVEGAALDFGAMHRKKAEVISRLRNGMEEQLSRQKVTLLRGSAMILAPGRVVVNGVEHTAESILIATGAAPSKLPVPGLENAMTSDQLLEEQEKVFQSLVIIGGGVIGVELATLYLALGCQVTVLEAMDRLLPTMDREISQNLAMIWKRRKVEVLTGAMVSAVEKKKDGRLQVYWAAKDRKGVAEGEAVLCATGRKPCTEALFGPDFSLKLDRGRIVTDENDQTSVPGVYAIGDAASKIQLAHVAAAQGSACAARLAGKASAVDVSLIPSCIYTSPEIASVGITPDEARAARLAVKTGKALMGGNGRTVIADGARGFIKVTASGETGVLLGAQLMCERATDMISQFTAAIADGMTVSQLARAMRPHPTFDEAVSGALEDLARKLAR